jgi:hypothetical protein
MKSKTTRISEEIVLHHTLPLKIKLPNAKTQKEMKESSKGINLKTFSNYLMMLDFELFS